jgi:hypothetical protein
MDFSITALPTAPAKNKFSQNGNPGGSIVIFDLSFQRVEPRIVNAGLSETNSFATNIRLVENSDD